MKNDQQKLVALVGELRKHQASRRQLLGVLANVIALEVQVMDQMAEEFRDIQVNRLEPARERDVHNRILRFLEDGPKLPEEITDELNRQKFSSKTSRDLRSSFYRLVKSGDVIRTKYGQLALASRMGVKR